MYIFLFDPLRPGGGEIWPNNRLGKKGMRKGGEMPMFSPIGKKYAYFFPNRLIIHKNEKNAENFSPAAHTPHYNKCQLGKKYKSRRGGGGKNMNFKFNIHP